VPSESLFQFRQFAGECVRASEGAAHPHKRPNDEDAHLDGARTVENGCGHDGAVLGEGVWQVLDIRAAFQDHNL